MSTPVNPFEQDQFARRYLDQNPDVGQNDYFRQNPFEHYNMYGKNEGRQWGGMMSGTPPPSTPPPFSGRPSQTPPGTGGLSPNPNQPVAPNPPKIPYTNGPGSVPKGTPAGFDPDMYLRLNSDVKDAGIDPYTHYLMFGREEGRKWQTPNAEPSRPAQTPLVGGQMGGRATPWDTLQRMAMYRGARPAGG